MREFPKTYIDRIKMVVEVGDLLVTEVDTSFWTLLRKYWPKIWKMFQESAVDRGIEAYQEAMGRKYPSSSHVKIVVSNNKTFEYTYPRARFGTLDEFEGRFVAICRPVFPFDGNKLYNQCKSHQEDELVYDTKKLFWFVLSEMKNHVDKDKATLIDVILQTDLLDKGKRWVCSTGACNDLNEVSPGKNLKDWAIIDPALLREDPRFAVYNIDKVVIG